MKIQNRKQKKANKARKGQVAMEQTAKQNIRKMTPKEKKQAPEIMKRIQMRALNRQERRARERKLRRRKKS